MSKSTDHVGLSRDFAFLENLSQPALDFIIVVTMLLCNKNALRVLGIALNTGTQALFMCTEKISAIVSLGPVLCST